MLLSLKVFINLKVFIIVKTDTKSKRLLLPFTTQE